MSSEFHEAPQRHTRPLARNRGEGLSFGTFGELLQGALPGVAMDFLVTFPIELYSRAVFHPEQPLSVHPPAKSKALRLTQAMLAHYQLPCSGQLEIISQIPEGKGLASSSADLVATARAVADCFGLPLKYHDLERFLRDIEPTDGVMYPGAACFYHRKVELREFISPLPPLTVLAIDEGGMLDTVEYNQKRKDYSEAEKQEYEVLLENLRKCLLQKDLEGLGRVATRSAVLNQRFNPKHTLPLMMAVVEEVGALGVVTAHSGTCVGVLLSREDEAFRSKLEKSALRLSGITSSVETYHSWQGGADGGISEGLYNNPLWLRCG